jgi:hypothetical protein
MTRHERQATYSGSDNGSVAEFEARSSGKATFQATAVDEKTLLSNRQLATVEVVARKQPCTTYSIVNRSETMKAEPLRSMMQLTRA